MTTPTMNLYGQTYDQIVQKVLGGGGQNFQLMSPQQDWTWAPATVGFINDQAYRFVGQVPNWSNSGTYVPGGSDMNQTYLQVLSLWNALGQGLDEDRVRQADEEVTRTRNKLTTDTLQANDAFTTYTNSLQPGIPKPSYDEFMADQGWKGTLDMDRAALDKALETKGLVVAAKNPDLKKAIDAATVPTDKTPKPGFVQVQIGMQTSMRPFYVFEDPKVWSDRVAAGGGTSLSISLSGKDQSYSMEKSWAGGSTGLDWGFFGVYGNGGWNKLNIEEEDKSVQVNITIDAYKLTEVSPAPEWYNGGILNRMSTENNWNPPFSTSGGDGKKPVFGKDGVFPLKLTGMVVGLRMSVDIKTTSSVYKKYKEHWDASGGIRIGPFRIGGSGGHDEEKWSKNTDNQQFHVESKATYPFILGVTVVNPGDGK